MKKLVLIDGNALLHRAYHATPPFTTSKGELVNAVYGFSSMLLKALSELKPDFVAIAWDEKGPTFRHQAYTQYLWGVEWWYFMAQNGYPQYLDYAKTLFR